MRPYSWSRINLGGLYHPDASNHRRGGGVMIVKTIQEQCEVIRNNTSRSEILNAIEVIEGQLDRLEKHRVQLKKRAEKLESDANELSNYLEWFEPEG